MRRVTLAGLALVGALLLAIPSAFAQSNRAAADPGISARSITIGGTLPADRSRLELRAHSGGDEGVLQLHQRPPRTGRQARHLRPPGRLQVLRRRLQPGQLRPARAEVRAGGQGLCHRRHARHRGEPGRAAVPQLVQGAARPRLDGCERLRQGLQEVPVDDRLAARLHRRRPALRARPREEAVREDRDPVSERQLRQGLPGRLQVRARRRRSPGRRSSARRRSR